MKIPPFSPNMNPKWYKVLSLITLFIIFLTIPILVYVIVLVYQGRTDPAILTGSATATLAIVTIYYGLQAAVNAEYNKETLNEFVKNREQSSKEYVVILAIDPFRKKIDELMESFIDEFEIENESSNVPIHEPCPLPRLPHVSINDPALLADLEDEDPGIKNDIIEYIGKVNRYSDEWSHLVERLSNDIETEYYERKEEGDSSLNLQIFEEDIDISGIDEVAHGLSMCIMHANSNEIEFPTTKEYWSEYEDSLVELRHHPKYEEEFNELEELTAEISSNSISLQNRLSSLRESYKTKYGISNARLKEKLTSSTFSEDDFIVSPTKYVYLI